MSLESLDDTANNFLIVRFVKYMKNNEKGLCFRDFSESRYTDPQLDLLLTNFFH